MYCSCCGEVIEEDSIDDEEVCEDCSAMLNGEVSDKDPDDLDVETLIE